MIKWIKAFLHWIWYGYEPDIYVSQKCLNEIRYNLGKERK